MLPFASALVWLLTSAPLAAQSAAGVIAGRTVNVRGEPVPGTMVYVEGHLREHGALSDDDGRFVLRGVPKGRQVVVVENLGYEPDVYFVRLDEDSVNLTFRMSEVVVPISGGETPFPDQDVRRTATRILPELLRSGSVADSIRANWAALPPGDTAVVWAPWQTPPTEYLLEGRPYLRVVSTCSECVGLTGMTIEGGRHYEARMPHVLVGVSAREADTSRIMFCMGVVNSGTTVKVNCSGLRRRWKIMYARAPDGEWIGFIREWSNGWMKMTDR